MSDLDIVQRMRGVLDPFLLPEKRINIDGEHYRQGIESVDYIQSHGMDFAEGNIVKYITRYRLKGSPLADLEKIEFYVKELKKRFE